MRSSWLSSLIAIATYTTGVFSLPAITGRPHASTSSWHDNAVYGLFTGRHYQSTLLNPPHARIGKSDGCDSLYTFHGPDQGWQALTIVDGHGQLVWMADRWGHIRDTRVHEYRGQDYITFWNAAMNTTFEDGTYYMLDSSYETAYKIHPYGNVTGTDPYGFDIFGESAVMTVRRPAHADLSSIGGPKNASIFDSLVQEIDIATGKLVFQWSALQYFSPRESLERYRSRQDSSKDIFHINSIDKDDQGNYIILFRYLHAIVCVNPDGDVLWTLGGKRNSFYDLSNGKATRITTEHRAKWQPGNVIKLLETDVPDRRASHAAHHQGVRIALDPGSITAILLQESANSSATLTHAQHPSRPTSTGDALAGSSKHSTPYTESSSGNIICDAALGVYETDKQNSYRKFKGKWTGRPKRRPDVAIRNGFSDMNVYVSWNGATDVRHWRVEAAGDRPGETIVDLQHRGHDSFAPLVTVPRAGFETRIQTKTSERYVRVVGLDDKHVPLGSSIIDTKNNIIVMYNGSRMQVSNTASRDITTSWLIMIAIVAVFYNIWKRAPHRPFWHSAPFRRLHYLADQKCDSLANSKFGVYCHDYYVETAPTVKTRARKIVSLVLGHRLFPRRLQHMLARYSNGG
ncbi:hypothetical protein MBLNU457_g2478t1 [Dothideomycetes sp. NU457]